MSTGKANRLLAFAPENSSDQSQTPERRALLPEQFLHLVALNAFAIAQPILGKLSGNLQYLRHESFSGVAVLIAFAILFLALPLLSLSVMRIAQSMRSPRVSEILFRTVLTTYGVLIGLLVSRWISAELELMEIGISDIAMLIVAIPIGLVLAWLYLRSAGIRQCISLSSIGLLLFPISFFSSAAAREIVFGIQAKDYSAQTQAENPAPLVMIVFDGMTGMSLLDEFHEIDAIRYPNFARLAQQSTFFRNATTVHTRTDHALPAMLSGALPEENWLPIEAHYPTNLFRLLYNSNQFEMTVFEPYTRLAPTELQSFELDRTLKQDVSELTETTLRLYLNLVFPRELIAVSIPRSWFGLSPKVLDRQKFMRGRVVYGWDEFRSQQAEHFVSSIRVSEKPGMYFLHLAVPHYPWSLLPDGRSYMEDQFSATISIPGAVSERWCDDDWPVNLCWQRNLLQIQYADHIVGQVLDKLSESGQLDTAMVIVTADHGLAFQAGREMRELSEQTKPDLLSIPLFIKRPYQTTGTVSDKSVETIDVLPTIADVLQFSSAPEWQGCSVFSDEVRLRKTVTGPIPTIIDAAFPERFQFVDRMLQVFGSGHENDRLGKLNLIPELIGKHVEQIVGDKSRLSCDLSRGQLNNASTNQEIVPCLLAGRFTVEKAFPEPIRIAVAVDGIVAVTTRTSTADLNGTVWTALIPPALIEGPNHAVEIYQIEGSEASLTLHQIETN